uniref:ATP synthase subunit a n=1 Tax=Platypus contaminatus TaxID=2066526 RepID=A0A6C0RUZ3_9CUCU|nr:ATP synthase F0 subunit 6 [Platypus contaminatus]QIA44532.1 ATP synthase F0 subunit 6 [Platypus contaminatus]
MMMNLFSTFDPTTSSLFSLNWICLFSSILFIPLTYWIIPSRLNFIWLIVFKTLYKEFKTILNKKENIGSNMIITPVFMVIALSNFLGLFPYIFTSTSHLSITLALSLPFWLSFMFMGWWNNSIHMLAHLVPQGAPGILLPFLVIVETISNIIRPGTLAVRLSANMIAGHLLLTLMSNSCTMSPMILSWTIVVSQMALMILELAVAFIQAYVFSILTTLYLSEIN